MRTEERRLRAEHKRELRAEELELEQDFEEGEDSGALPQAARTRRHPRPSGTKW